MITHNVHKHVCANVELPCATRIVQQKATTSVRAQYCLAGGEPGPGVAVWRVDPHRLPSGRAGQELRGGPPHPAASRACGRERGHS
eukprot:1156182-Pelagomonas_calceolata.AAC.8